MDCLCRLYKKSFLYCWLLSKADVLLVQASRASLSLLVTTWTAQQLSKTPPRFSWRRRQRTRCFHRLYEIWFQTLLPVKKITKRIGKKSHLTHLLPRKLVFHSFCHRKQNERNHYGFQQYCILNTENRCKMRLSIGVCELTLGMSPRINCNMAVVKYILHITAGVWTDCCSRRSNMAFITWIASASCASSAKKTFSDQLQF